MLNGHPELCCVDEGLAVEVEVDVVVKTEFSSTTKSLVKNLSNMGNGCIWRIAKRRKGGRIKGAKTRKEWQVQKRECNKRDEVTQVLTEILVDQIIGEITRNKKKDR